MDSKTLIERLRTLQKALEWKLFKIGEYDSGVVYLEFETTEQYDEYQFDKKSELSLFVDECYKAIG